MRLIFTVVALAMFAACAHTSNPNSFANERQCCDGLPDYTHRIGPYYHELRQMAQEYTKEEKP